MFLSRFRVRGYKGLEDAEIAPTPLHAIFGPNDSGKSSLLEAISALYGRLKTPPTKWLPPAESPRQWVTRGSKSPTIDLVGQWSQQLPPDGRPTLAAGYGFTVLLPERGNSVGVMDQWVRPLADDPGEGLSQRALPYPPERGTATAADRAAEIAFREVVQVVLQPALVYRFDPRRLAEPVESAAEHPAQIDADGYGLAALLADVAKRYPQRFAAIEGEFCRLMPRYGGLCFHLQSVMETPRPRRGRPVPAPMAACGLRFKMAGGETIAAHEASDGALRLLALIALARTPEPPPLVLIENPEQDLFPPLIAEVIGLFREMTQWSAERLSPQVIVTTHSPQALACFRPEETTNTSLLRHPAS